MNFLPCLARLAVAKPLMPDDMKDAPEIIIAPELAAAGKFLPTCSPEATKSYTAIWTELQK